MGNDIGKPVYPALERLVAGRRVVVVSAKNSQPPHVDDAVVVRFNSDEMPAHIWVTAFWGPPSATLSRGAELIVGSVPDSIEAIDSHAIVKDFPRERKANLALISSPLPPVELIDTAHWRALREQTPAIPLSGIAFLAMLETTTFARCDIHGMNFYVDSAPPLYRGRWFGHVHDLPLAARWLGNLLQRDERFRVCGAIPGDLLPQLQCLQEQALREYDESQAADRRRAESGPPLEPTPEAAGIHAIANGPGLVWCFVDNVKACRYDSEGAALRLEFQIVALLKNAPAGKLIYCDSAAGVWRELSAPMVRSPYVGKQNPDIPWAECCRFVVADVIPLPAPPVAPAILASSAEGCFFVARLAGAAFGRGV